jgi:hypothetical protein
VGLPCGLSPCPPDFYCRARGPTSTGRLCEDVPAYGSVLLRQRFHLRTVLTVTRSRGSWHVISAVLCTSPCRSDCIIHLLVGCVVVWRAVSEGSRARLLGPSLLIARTPRIVTARRNPASTEGFSDVPAFSQIFLRNYNGQLIVTAAVYWGFGSMLRDYSLTYPLNLPAPGRHQTLYVLLRVRRVLCF